VAGSSARDAGYRSRNDRQRQTTLLKNIIVQDLMRRVGPPEERHRIPMVIFDGKGIWNSSRNCCPTFTALAGSMTCG
jgi:hypothetical protein